MSKQKNLIKFLDGRNLLAHTTEDKIKGFSKLKNGWCYGEGIGFKSRTIDLAIKIFQEAKESGFKRTDAFPGRNGQVLVTLYHKEHYLEFTVYPSSKIDFCYELNKQEMEDNEEIEFDDVKEILKRYREEIWSSSDAFIQESSTKEMSDSKAQLSSHHLMEESLFLTKTVPSKHLEVYAST